MTTNLPSLVKAPQQTYASEQASAYTVECDWGSTDWLNCGLAVLAAVGITGVGLGSVISTIIMQGLFAMVLFACCP